MIKRSFPAVIDERTRLVILGSLPGEASLARGQYYAHPQNQFWRLIGDVIGVELKLRDYPDRLAALLDKGVGLWDVVAMASRIGSLDGAIRDHRPNNLAALREAWPRLAALGFNGAAAERIGRKALTGVDLPMLRLPSSSPAYTLHFDSKREAWLALRAYL